MTANQFRHFLLLSATAMLTKVDIPADVSEKERARRVVTLARQLVRQTYLEIAKELAEEQEKIQAPIVVVATLETPKREPKRFIVK